jgi:hypothetical protein
VHCNEVLVLATLNQENHQECNDCCARINDQGSFVFLLLLFAIAGMYIYKESGEYRTLRLLPTKIIIQVLFSLTFFLRGPNVYRCNGYFR